MISSKYDIPLDIDKKAKKVLDKYKVAIFVVAYNAERQIEQVLQRIPPSVAEKVVEIFVIDDHSQDNTIEVTKKIKWPENFAPFNVYRTPYNQGYGGNQRLGYLYAIEKGYDFVVLLHADGRYAPEVLPRLIAAHADGADVVYGSRFIYPNPSLREEMPYYKWLGNRVLTFLQNKIVGTDMSEFHSAFCSLRVDVLKKIPFQFNSLGFDFNTDLIIQSVAAKLKLTEVAIPCYYGEEIRTINGFGYAWGCLKSSLKFLLMKIELFYDPKFDIRDSTKNPYTIKKAVTSLHHYMRQQKIKSKARVLDVGGGNGGAVGEHYAQHGMEVVNIDRQIDQNSQLLKNFVLDLDLPWSSQLPQEEYESKFDTVLALDILEHLKSPENAVSEIFKLLKSGGKLYASTGNISFLPLRFMHAMGQFNYGRRGILDLTHTRLFNVASFKRLLTNYGFAIDKVIGFGPPIEDLSVKSSLLLKIIDRAFFSLARIYPRLFAFQILIVCSRTDSPSDLMRQTFAVTHSSSVSAQFVSQ